MGVSMAFYAGKISNGFVTIDNLRWNVQHLEQELVKKTGIELRAENRQESKAEQAFTKAESLLKQGDLVNAGLYFSNGISQEPGNWAKINRYQQSVLDYCQKRVDNGDYEMAFNVLSDMKSFMLNQTLYLHVKDIDKLQQVLANITKLKESIIAKMKLVTQNEMTQFVKNLLAKSDKLVTQSLVVDSSNQTVSHIEVLKENLFSLQSLDTNVVKQNDPVKIAQQITQLESTIATFEQHLATAKAANNILTLVQLATQFIDNAKNESAQSDFILYYLTSAESIIRQLVLVTPNKKIVKMQIATLSKQLGQAKQEIAKRQSATILHEIEQAANQLEINKRGKAQKAIEQLIQFRQLVAEKASKLSSVEALEKAQARMQKVNTQIADWQAKRIRKYERWAVGQITNFYNKHLGELDATTDTDEERIESGILTYLGNIDIRYLSTPAQTAYNEAFQKFYPELNDEQKIPLSAKMALMDKKPLSDF